ncbi:hypothetical protein VPNG_02170 [Cytospora leucostoma]|uniref:Intradiol ring-cleavage dioxygenases domain-containing protein n=1 Tax=Cytospora leucostoma TaxID=1230097 RepID=A0A423XHI3_9PEZI|nr:hypothetical protein VPNG_02170 [Cytospora leucostoma]
MVAFTKMAAAGLTLAAGVLAHPGEHHDHEEIRRDIEARDLNAAIGARALAQCSGGATARRMKQRSVQRRADKVRALREARGIKANPKKYRRDLADLEEWETVNHNKTGTYDYNAFTALETVFGANTSCVQTPIDTAGPYYIVGEYFRSNVKEVEHSDGVDLFLEVQYVDVTSCAPVPNVAVDVWNANATGVYSGVEGNSDLPEGGLNSTFLRGIQVTDNEGVVSFETIFPGHYESRATHTHLLAHTNTTILPNGTISLFNKPVAHIGQLFFPEDLRSAVEATYPYNTNTVEVTSNDDDMWSIVQADSSFDPFPQFVYLGDDITDGLFAWIQIGINATADYQSNEYYAVAGWYAEDGGHSSGNTLGAPSSSGSDGSGNGTEASGAAPSGAAPSSA